MCRLRLCEGVFRIGPTAVNELSGHLNHVMGDNMNEKLRDAQTDLLFSAILSLKNIDECYAFFEDISTISELKSLAQRFQVALMLYRGQTYMEICEATGVSTATISRVNRCLEYGADGYKLVLDRLDQAGLLPKDPSPSNPSR